MAAPPGPQLVEHDPGMCEECDLYHQMRKRVVMIRADDSLGAGVVVDPSGLVVSSAHVVQGATSLAIKTADGSIWDAHIVRSDPESDLVLIQMEGTVDLLVAADLGYEGQPPVGSETFVLGHPLGLGWTITRGIISARREPGELGPVAMIQTDAAISPGNSGGPLLDSDGHVLGIVTAKLVGEGSESLAFAIPVPVVRKFLAEAMPPGY